jgi:transposase
MIGDRKMMAPVFWNRESFHLVDALSKGQKFNASYDVDIILQNILDNRSTGSGPGLITHADNARAHTAQKTLRFCWESRLEMALPPPYSSDLALSDFFLFAHVKHALEEPNFHRRDSSDRNSVNSVGSHR